MKAWWIIAAALVLVLGIALNDSEKSVYAPGVMNDQHDYSASLRSAEETTPRVHVPVRVEPAPATYSPLYVAGYPCTVDCSGHEAGYEWAEENGIDDPDDCDGNSESFIEGCQAYAEDQQGYGDEGGE